MTKFLTFFMKLTRYFVLIIVNLLFAFNVLANTASTNSLPETNNLVMAGEKFITLLGNQIAIGDQAPNFKVVNGTFSPVTLADFTNKTLLISVVPSLDTGVCSLQTKRFNDEVSNFSDEVVMLTISNDLPFAQKRFCKNENVEKVQVLSDAVWRDFGSQYGLLIKDMGLLTRAIIIIDNQGKVSYKELVKNISNHPNYDLALSELNKLTSVTQPQQ
ncbi:thiol peroxidase [Colwellia sp. 1_MG-2023]|uniref:thiol peroxidase n=1 Tax=Colwellia sp. 1_MG-2023 TaxID=3062649 RepID=UPI0026E48C57|nr:thiol peroxidase [Colwellia sp. 1_MG-2023]